MRANQRLIPNPSPHICLFTANTGQSGGLMDILPPIWGLKDGLEDAERIAV
jgi:hypothetical protein